MPILVCAVLRASIIIWFFCASVARLPAMVSVCLTSVTSGEASTAAAGSSSRCFWIFFQASSAFFSTRTAIA